MAGQSITLHVPDDLYQRVKQEAARTRRTIEEEVLEVVALAMPGQAELPDELAMAVEQLHFLDDEALVRAARRHLHRQAARRLEALHLQRQREGLDQAESQEAEQLVRQYERAMLIRAHAVLLLKERGHNIASFAQGA